MDKKKILYLVPNLRIGSGVTSVVMQHYDALAEAGYRMDFCMTKNDPSPFHKKVRENGGRIFVMPRGADGYLDKKKTPPLLKKILTEGNYGIVHTHIIGRFAVWAGYYAARCHVPVRIFHAHNPRDLHDLPSALRSAVFDTPCVLFYNHFMACSGDAARSMFGRRPFVVLRNTIDVRQFVFSEEKRNKARAELGIAGDRLTVGTVCRFTWQKNPFFTIDVFEQILKRQSGAVLLWAGSGMLQEKVRTYAAEKGLGEAVLFLGDREDISALYSAMDLFLLPSRYEGLGIVAVEAQAAGLPSFVSDRLPEEACLTELLCRLSLKDSASDWADSILAAMEEDNLVPEPRTGNRSREPGLREKDRSSYAAHVSAAGYDSDGEDALLAYYDSLTNVT